MVDHYAAVAWLLEGGSGMKNHKCLFCEDTFTEQDLSEMKEMGETYHLEPKQFVCPDCYDDLQRLPLEEQLKALLQGAEYKWPD